jgi:hypothetical protein
MEIVVFFLSDGNDLHFSVFFKVIEHPIIAQAKARALLKRSADAE